MLSRFHRILLNDKNFSYVFQQNGFYCKNIFQVIESLDNLVTFYKTNFDNDTIENIKNNSQIFEKIKYLNFYYNVEDYISPTDENLVKSFIHYITYQYKYGNLTNFWKENLLLYFSNYDKKIIENDDKLLLLFNSFGIILDKIDEMIEKMKNLYNLDEVETEYLNYVSELFGLHKETFSITIDDNAFREILKYIRQFYKMKGNAKVYAIFFKLLGYDVEMIQLFWDRDRFFSSAVSILNSTLKNEYKYYLTSVDPRRRPNYPIKDNELQDKKDFYRLESVTLENLGITDTYVEGCTPCPFKVENDEFGIQYYYLPNNNNQFRYFKTNYIIFKLKLNTVGLTSDSQTILNNYINFFTPINIYADILMVSKPMEEQLYNSLKLLLKEGVDNSEILLQKDFENFYNAEIKQELNKFYQLQNFTTKLDKFNNGQSVIGFGENIYSVNVTEKSYFVNSIENVHILNSEKIKDSVGIYFIRNGLRNNRKLQVENQNITVYTRKLMKYFFFENLNHFIIIFNGDNIQNPPYYEISYNENNIYNIECVYDITDNFYFDKIYLQRINVPIPPLGGINPNNPDLTDYEKFLVRVNSYQSYLYSYRFLYDGDNELIKDNIPNFITNMFNYVTYWNKNIFQNSNFKYENSLLILLKELKIII